MARFGIGSCAVDTDLSFRAALDALRRLDARAGEDREVPSEDADLRVPLSSVRGELRGAAPDR